MRVMERSVKLAHTHTHTHTQNFGAEGQLLPGASPRADRGMLAVHLNGG